MCDKLLFGHLIMLPNIQFKGKGNGFEYCFIALLWCGHTVWNNCELLLLQTGIYYNITCIGLCVFMCGCLYVCLFVCGCLLYMSWVQIALAFVQIVN